MESSDKQDITPRGTPNKSQTAIISQADMLATLRELQSTMSNVLAQRSGDDEL